MNSCYSEILKKITKSLVKGLRISTSSSSKRDTTNVVPSTLQMK